MVFGVIFNFNTGITRGFGMYYRAGGIPGELGEGCALYPPTLEENGEIL